MTYNKFKSLDFTLTRKVKFIIHIMIQYHYYEIN